MERLADLSVFQNSSKLLIARSTSCKRSPRHPPWIQSLLTLLKEGLVSNNLSRKDLHTSCESSMRQNLSIGGGNIYRRQGDTQFMSTHLGYFHMKSLSHFNPSVMTYHSTILHCVCVCVCVCVLVCDCGCCSYLPKYEWARPLSLRIQRDQYYVWYSHGVNYLITFDFSLPNGSQSEPAFLEMMSGVEMINFFPSLIEFGGLATFKPGSAHVHMIEGLSRRGYVSLHKYQLMTDK